MNIHRQEGDCVIDITDEGPGIPDYVGERVFERFFSCRGRIRAEKHRTWAQFFPGDC